MSGSPAGLSPADYAELSALFDEISELDAPLRAERVAALRRAGHALAAPLARMLEALDGPRTDELLPAWAPQRQRAGTQVGPWRLIEALGSGGMAEVWLAQRAPGGLKREVALKLPHPLPGAAGAARAQRFERERDILAALRHPHIAALLDAGVEPDGQAWLAIERVEGRPITEWCDARRATLRERVALFRQVLLAVQHAHAQLVIHRDLKPANVLVDAAGEVRLLDFGIAKLLADGRPLAEDTALTQQAGRPLTPLYASPEQLRGQALSTASDLYSLGVLLHELLSGRLPYALPRGGAAELERAVVEVEVAPPSRTPPSAEAAAARSTTPRALQKMLAPELDAVLLRLLAKRPADRYSSVDALLADIDRWRAGVPVQARTPGVWFRLWRFVRRHPWAVGSGVALAATLAGLSITALTFALQARQQSERAVRARDFMFDLFRRTDEAQSKGDAVTARELLDWGRRGAAALPAPAQERAELLVRIAEAQVDMGDFTRADLAYADAARLYRDAHEVTGAVGAEVERAQIAARWGDLARAAAFLDAARAAMPAAPAPGLVARWEGAAGWVATKQGRSAEAATHVARAASAAERAWAPDDWRRIELFSQYALSADVTGQPGRGLAVLDSLLGQLAPYQGVAGARGRASLESDRADIEVRLGRYGAVASRLSAVLARCEADVGPRTEYCNGIRRTLALALLRRGDLVQAEALLPAIRDEGNTSDHPMRRVEGLLLSARILASGGHVDESASPWPELEAVALAADATPRPEHLRTSAQLALAEAMLRVGRPSEADRWIVALRQRFAAGAAGTPAQALRVDMLAGASLYLQGRGDEALQTWRAAHDRAMRQWGPQHPMAWLYAANMVPLLQSAGRDEEARSVLAQALPVLQAALGEDAPAYLRVAGWQRDPVRARPAAPSDLLL